LTYPFHDRDIVVTACGRICLHRKKINISTVLAGQKLGIKEVDDGIWLKATGMIACPFVRSALKPEGGLGRQRATPPPASKGNKFSTRDRPSANAHLPFSLRQRLRDFASVLDEKPGYRAERAVLQSYDRDRLLIGWQFDRQCREQGCLSLKS
jgi:hypothetical protein